MKNILVFSLVFVLLGILASGCAPAAPTVAPASPPAVPSDTPAPAAPANTEPPAATSTSLPATDTAVPPTEASAAVFDGQAVLERACTACHSLGRVENKKASADEWAATVNRMVGKGAALTADEQAALIQYLAETFK